MIFTQPVPFSEALQTLSDKGLLPTGLSSRELSLLEPEIREVAIFSARMNNAAAVQKFKDLTEQLLSPGGRAPGEGLNVASARAKMQEYLRDIGYTPEGGFEGEARVPSATRGSLQDLSSNTRLDLMIKTKVQQMAQSGYGIQQDTPVARNMYPCWELVRVGVLKGGPDAARDWPARWRKCGGKFYAGRMIAPKDDPIWQEIGSTANFDDALDTDVPPYAFGSHMTRRAVARAVCISLGVIKASFVPKSTTVSVRSTAQASAIPFSADFLASLKKDLGAEVEAGRIKLAANVDDAVLMSDLARWLTWRHLAINAHGANV